MTEITAIERERYSHAATAASRNVRRVAGAEVDDGEARWYLATCAPDCDAKAARWLARRRFGIFQPMARDGHHLPSDRRTRGARELAFPGYIFVRLWNVDKMVTRLLACPGVEGVLPVTGKPVAIPDEFISQLYALDWIEDTSAAGKRVAATGRRNRYRKPRKSNKIVSKEQRRSARLLIKDLANAGRLDAEGRIGQLLKAVLP